MKRALIATVLMVLLAAAAAAETCGDYEYTVSPDGNAAIVRYTGHAAELVIPDVLDGHPVTAIGSMAFFPAAGDRDPLLMYGDPFLEPGTYISVYAARGQEPPDGDAHRHLVRLPDDAEQAMARYLARKWAWEQGCIVFDDAVRDDAGRMIPADVSVMMEGRIANLQGEIDRNNQSIEESLERMQNMPEAGRRSFEARVEGMRQQVEAAQAAIDELRAALAEGRAITEAEAVRRWSEATGLRADGTHRAELIALWAREYEPVMAASSPEEMQALGLGDFSSGMGFLTLETGLGMSQTDAVNLVRIAGVLSPGAQGEVRVADVFSLEELADGVTFPMGTDQYGYDISLAGESPLTSVVIPAGVKVIDHYAFLDCRNLTSVTLPAGLETLCMDAFAVREADPGRGKGELRCWYGINPGLTFTAPRGSDTANYLENAGYRYVTAD